MQKRQPWTNEIFAKDGQAKNRMQRRACPTGHPAGTAEKICADEKLEKCRHNEKIDRILSPATTNPCSLTTYDIVAKPL